MDRKYIDRLADSLSLLKYKANTLEQLCRIVELEKELMQFANELLK